MFFWGLVKIQCVMSASGCTKDATRHPVSDFFRGGRTQILSAVRQLRAQSPPPSHTPTRHGQRARAALIAIDGDDDALRDVVVI